MSPKVYKSQEMRKNIDLRQRMQGCSIGSSNVSIALKEICFYAKQNINIFVPRHNDKLVYTASCATIHENQQTA